MDICDKCFNSESVSNYIKKKGEKLQNNKKCSFCNNSSKYRMDKYTFKSKVQSIIREHYQHETNHGLVGSASMMAEEEDDISDFLPQAHDLTYVCYDLFEIDNDKIFYDLLTDDSRYDDGLSEFNGDYYDDVWINIGRDWEGTSYIPLEWDTFCKNIKHKARYFDHSQYNRIDELSKLKKTFKTLSKEVSTTLYRARKANEKEKLKNIKNNPSKELGIASPDKAGHNRFSPSGIPYIYLSEDKKTILKEIRAINEDRVAIGQFSISNLNLVDLRKDNLSKIKNDIFHDCCTPEILCSFKTLKNFLEDITKKVEKEDNHLEYIPTQIVSEYIWSLKYDGFIFDSSLGDGTNYVLFKDSYKFIKYHIKRIKEI